MFKKLFIVKKIIFNQYLTIKYSFSNENNNFPEIEKSVIKKMIDLFYWQIYDRDFNWFYYAMGLNLKINSISNFIGRREFLLIKNKTEKYLKTKAGCNNLDYSVLTKDKFIFNLFLKTFCPETAELYGVIIKKTFFDLNGNEKYLFEELADLKSFVLKNITLEASTGVFICSTNDESLIVGNVVYTFESFSDFLGENIWVVQKKYSSHKLLKNNNNSALNTTRIVTVLNGNKPEYLTGFQSFSSKNSQTDSWDKGSVYVGIDYLNGTLKKYGIRSIWDREKGLIEKHPDYDLIFNGFHLPFFKESVNLCIKMHKLLYFNFIIGWDVAITDSGPIIIEANEKPGMNVVQCFDGGLRRKLNTLMLRITNN